MDFRTRVRNEIERQDLKIKDVAEKAGISINTLGMYIGPRASMPSADIAFRLAKVLKVPLEFLLDSTDRTLSEFLYGQNADGTYPWAFTPDAEVAYLEALGGKVIEGRNDSRISNYHIKRNGGYLPHANKINPDRRGIENLLNILDSNQLSALYKIVKVFVRSVTFGKE